MLQTNAAPLSSEAEWSAVVCLGLAPNSTPHWRGPSGEVTLFLGALLSASGEGGHSSQAGRGCNETVRRVLGSWLGGSGRPGELAVTKPSGTSLRSLQ